MSKIIDAKKNGYQITYTGEKAERFIRPNGEYQQLSYGDGTTTVSSHRADGIKTDKEKEETKTVTSYDDHGQPTTVTTTKEGAHDSVEQTIYQDTVQGTTRTTTTTQGEEKETSVIKTDAMGRETENTCKDRKGNILSSTETSYDFMGRAIQTKVTSDGVTQTESKTYDDNGTVATETSASGIKTAYRYDSLNRVIKATESADGTDTVTETSYGYEDAQIHTLNGTKDYQDLSVQTTKTNGHVSKKSWTDAAGQTVRSFSHGLYTDHVFTSDGKEIATISLGTKTSGDGKIALQLYDKEGKQTAAIQNPEITRGTSDATVKVGNSSILQKTEYDTKGNETAKTDGNGDQISYAYDDQNRVTEITQGGQKTKVSYQVNSDGSTTTSVTDANGHVKQETASASGSVTTTSDLGDGSESITTKYTYDSFDRVKEMIYTDLETGKVMESYQYSYDKNSNITEKTQVNNYPKEDADKVNETKVYTYDTLGRLTKTVTTDHKKDDKTKTVTYTYDNVGNRLKEDDGTTTTSYTYNGLDQLKTSTKEKGTAVEEVRQYDYDANGNQTDVKNTRTGEDQIYVYDAENRLSQVSVTKDGKTAVIQQNIYNGEGQRIQKIDGDETINYYYQDGVVAYTTDTDGNQNSQNLIGTDGNVLATERFQQNATQYYLYNKDIQGSTSSLVKEDGSADATYQYTDFGETTIQGDDQADNEVCYTGGIYDQTTGLYYLNARYYDPEDGRFLTEDTYRGDTAKPETGHLYVYCANNPVNYVDPSGHIAVKVANAIAGAAISVLIDISLKAFLHYIAKKGSLRGFKIRTREVAYSIISGMIDGVLTSSRLKRKMQTVAGGVKSAMISYISNRKKKLSYIVANVLYDGAAGALSGYLGKDGLGRSYWNRGLFRKGSYTYKYITIKYGTRIKITSRSFRMTKQVAKESARELMKGAKRTAVVSGIKSAIISLPNWFKKKR